MGVWVRDCVLVIVRFAMMLGLVLAIQMEIGTIREPTLWSVGLLVTSIGYAAGYSSRFAIPENSTGEGERHGAAWLLGFLIEAAVVAASSVACIPVGTIGLACVLHGAMPDLECTAAICGAPYQLGHRLAWG